MFPEIIKNVLHDLSFCLLLCSPIQGAVAQLVEHRTENP